ncbi:MAG: DUF4124 domain-containing protein [Pseudomonadales bacterium]|nr:DUF4124 domain-containing protein [Pseudomonadales bacterium]
MNSYLSLRYLSVILMSFCMLASASHAAEDVYYQWYDAAGKLNVSDQRPKSGVQYKTIKKIIKTSGGQSVAGELYQSVNKAEADKQRAAVKEQGQVMNEKARQNNCDIATEELRVISNSARVREIGTDGEYRYLTDEEKEERGKRAERNIEQYCNSESE